ncbi:MAG: hypothetical protein ACI81T_000349, partial [Bacteroidia bacterium]
MLIFIETPIIMDKQRAIAILLNKLEEWDTKSKKDGYE